MTNDTPPKACLADFGFTTMVLDPQDSLSSSFTLEGGTMQFMAPELLAPSRFGLRNAVPTKEGDVYAFGLVIFQVIVCAVTIYVPFPIFRQVLTEERPFGNIKLVELSYHVSFGVRPEKPGNAEAIGISDSLWKLVQECWKGDRMRRPRIQEVVAGVGDAAVNWDADMPPSNEEDSDAEEDSDELHHGEFSLVPIAPFFLRPSV